MTSITLNRRGVMVGLSAAAGSALLPKIGFAGELATLNIGNIEVSVLSDGVFHLPHSWFPNAAAEALAAAGDPIELGANAWLVKTADRVVLVDTGSGPAFDGVVPTVGKLDAHLAAHGIEKTDVTDIIISHMHADHIGGLIGPDAGGYANATIHMAGAEWTFWTDPDLVNRMHADMKELIEGQQAIVAPISDRIVARATDDDLGDGLRLVPLPGHTPGHIGVRISDGGQEMLIVADAILSSTLQLAEPGVTYVLDVDPDLAVETRVALLNQLADTGTVFAATHFSYPGVGRVERDGENFAFKPLS